jgi:hypothetical protein
MEMTIQKQRSGFTIYAQGADGVQDALAREIEKARFKEQPISFFAVAPMHPVHEKTLGALIKRVLGDDVTPRQGSDRIINETLSRSYFVSLGVPVSHMYGLADALQTECDALRMRYVGSVMYLPAGENPQEQARKVYACLEAGIQDHRRKMPVIYPNG